MSIAYFITCHQSKSFIEDQFQVLYRQQDLYIYHVDPKAPDDLKDYIQFLSAKNINVIIMPPRNYSWAGFSQVYAIIDAIVVALAYGQNWTHFIPLSEQHLPTIRPDEIERSLRAGTSYIGSCLYSEMPPDAQRDIRHRFDKRYVELAGVGSFAIAPVEPAEEFLRTLRHGSNWYVLSRRNCTYLRAYFANDQKIDRIKHCVHADETIIITLSYLYPELSGSIENIDKTFVAWPHLTDNHDMIFTEDNFFQAIAEGKFFIRKRPHILPERVKTTLGLQTASPKSVATGYARDDRSISMNPGDTLTILEQSIQEQFSEGSWKIHHRISKSNIPTLLMSYKTPKMPDDLSLFVVSQDNLNFKVAIVTDFGMDTLYVDRKFYDRDAFMLRVRVEQMFFHYELVITDVDSGFVELENPVHLQKIIDKIRLYVDEAEKLNLLTILNCTITTQ